MEDLIIYMLLAYVFFSIWLHGYIYDQRFNCIYEELELIKKRVDKND